MEMGQGARHFTGAAHTIIQSAENIYLGSWLPAISYQSTHQEPAGPAGT